MDKEGFFAIVLVSGFLFVFFMMGRASMIVSNGRVLTTDRWTCTRTAYIPYRHETICTQWSMNR